MQIESITTWYNVTKVTQSKENDMATQEILEHIKNTITRIEQQKGSPLTLRQKLFIANNRLDRLELIDEANEAADISCIIATATASKGEQQ